ncbi:MAG: hypothetical protein J2O46_03685 [Nocardioides sp.]|nr:hypothetical protein [Nocardioides sp.]
MNVYDAGVLIAADRGDRSVWARHQRMLAGNEIPTTTALVVAQASRSPQQAQLRRFLKSCRVLGFDKDAGHEIGTLLRLSHTSDVTDAHLVRIGAGSVIWTSDPDDLNAIAPYVDPRPLIRTI